MLAPCLGPPQGTGWPGQSCPDICGRRGSHQMLQLSFVGGLTGEYVDFTTAQHPALRMIAARGGRMIGEEEVVAGAGMVPSPVGAQPDIVATDLRELALRLRD